jgi:hypothetical protein
VVSDIEEIGLAPLYVELSSPLIVTESGAMAPGS